MWCCRFSHLRRRMNAKISKPDRQSFYRCKGKRGKFERPAIPLPDNFHEVQFLRDEHNHFMAVFHAGKNHWFPFFPGEQSLVAPVRDIAPVQFTLDRGHTCYILQIVTDEVKRSGCCRLKSKFTRHSQINFCLRYSTVIHCYCTALMYELATVFIILSFLFFDCFLFLNRWRGVSFCKISAHSQNIPHLSLDIRKNRRIIVIKAIVKEKKKKA